MVAEARVAGPSWGRGRTLLLDAARELFAERGYARASTREIARRASVTEPMLFRHFGTKARLFEEAVLAPFRDYIARYITEWEGRAHGVLGPVREARDFYRGLYDVLAGHRELIKVLIAADVAQGPLAGSGDMPPRLGAVLDRFERVIERERDERGFRPFDPAVQTRLMFGLVFSVAVHGDWMYDGSTRRPPDVDRLIDEMARFTIHGAYDRTGHPSWDGDEFDGPR